MIFLQLFVLLLLIYIIVLLSYSLLFGAPYAGIGNNRLITMFELLQPRKGKKHLDIGSGDGRIVIYAAKMGLDAHGFEINPLIFLISLVKIRRYGLKNAKVKLADFWKQDFSEFDYLTVWGTKHMVRALEKKLLKELRPGARIVSNHYQFPNWKHTREKNDVYLYIK